MGVCGAAPAVTTTATSAPAAAATLVTDRSAETETAWLPLVVAWHVFMSRNPHNWN